ncbi:MAG: hypothetical protein IT210_10725 [Armatimonadetes bacterium]|nr:hypothetical protein [Armatimonadota bacterium]
MATPAETAVFADAATILSCGGARTVYSNACAAACTKANRSPNNTRHQGGRNLVFADGHAKWYRAEAFAGQCGRFFWPDRSKDNRTYWTKWP